MNPIAERVAILAAASGFSVPLSTEVRRVIPVTPAAAPAPVRVRGGSHACFGKCGKAVSNNKKYCLDCYAAVIAVKSWNEGEPIERAEVKRRIEVELGIKAAA